MFWDLSDPGPSFFVIFLSLNNDVNVPSKSIKQKYREKKKGIFFVGLLKVTEEKNRIRSRIPIRKSAELIRGSGPVQKCHGSTTLVKTGNKK
jgi:hypothetical protein